MTRGKARLSVRLRPEAPTLVGGTVIWTGYVESEPDREVFVGIPAGELVRLLKITSSTMLPHVGGRAEERRSFLQMSEQLFSADDPEGDRAGS